MLALSDPYLRTAVAFIRDNACAGIGVSEVLEQVPVGRRTLEGLFRRELHRSPLQEIQRVRLAVARRLLGSTDLTVETIAAESGFGSVSRLSTAFREAFGVTPSVFRRAERGMVA